MQQIEERKIQLEKKKKYLGEIKQKQSKIENEIEFSKLELNHHDSMIKMHLKSEYEDKFTK